MESQNIWVRIKPRNEKKGLKIRKYLAFGMRFEEQLGWYKVPPSIELSDGRVVDTKEYLSNVRNDNDDPDSPLAFDVLTEQEARALDSKERKAAELRAHAVDARPLHPVDMTTADLNAPSLPSGDEPLPERELSEPMRPRRGRPPKTAA